MVYLDFAGLPSSRQTEHGRRIHHYFDEVPMKSSRLAGVRFVMTGYPQFSSIFGFFLKKNHPASWGYPHDELKKRAQILVDFPLPRWSTKRESLAFRLAQPLQPQALCQTACQEASPAWAPSNFLMGTKGIDIVHIYIYIYIYIY